MIVQIEREELSYLREMERLAVEAEKLIQDAVCLCSCGGDYYAGSCDALVLCPDCKAGNAWLAAFSKAREGR